MDYKIFRDSLRQRKGRVTRSCSAWCIVAFLSLPTAAFSQGRVPLELRADRDYSGPTQRVVVDSASQVTWLATPSTLYEISDGVPRVVDKGPGDGAQLALAPAGGFHAWLVRGQAPGGLFTIQLMAAPARRVAELKMEKFPYGFGALYLGAGGNLVVTATPLDDWQGLSGRFLYIFWNRDGKRLGDATLNGPRIGVVDPTGSAIVLLGETEVVAFGAGGQEIWRLPGRFRKAALADGGKLALLNPAERERLGQVVIVRNGKATVTRIPTPVHDMALSPDGSRGVIVGDIGRYFHVEVDSAEVKESAPLSMDGTFYITAARFLDEKTVVMGVAQRESKSSKRFTRGAVVAVGLDGQILLQRSIKIEDNTFAPLLGVTPGSRTFAAFTPQSTLILSVGSK